MDPDNPDFWNIRKNLHTLKTYFEKCESQRFEHQIQRISLTLLQPARPPIYCNKQKLHCNNFLQIYKTNHLNLTMKFGNCCKHWFYLTFYIEMFSRYPLKFQDFIIFDQFISTNTWYFIYILFHYKLKEK